MKERRKYIRIKPSMPINVKFKVIPEKRRKTVFKKGKTFPKNVSGSGMFIELPLIKPAVLEDLLTGKNKIALELSIPGYSPTVKILCRAIWVDKEKSPAHRAYGIGVEFEEIMEEDRERFLQYMLELILQ